MPPTPERRPAWRRTPRPARPRRSVRVLRALAVAYGLAATTALAAVLVFSDGNVAGYVLGLFAAWWLAPALLLVPVAAAAGSRRTLAAVTVPAVAAGAVFGPYLVNRLSPAPARADLRVATFNTSAWQGVDGVAALVRDREPDVLALQEVARSSRAAYDERFSGRYPYRSYAKSTIQGDGVAVWSRHPIVSVEPVTGLPEGARPADVVTLDVDGRRLAVVSVHFASPCLFCSPSAAKYSPAGDTANAARVRVAEARRFADLASERRAAGQAVVVAGDLNSAELNEPLRELRSHGLVDVHRAVGTRPGLTRGHSPGFARVDVVLVAGLEPVATGEGDPGGSTHSPVVADLAWPSEPS